MTASDSPIFCLAAFQLKTVVSFIHRTKKTFEPLHYFGLLILYKIRGRAFHITCILSEVVKQW